MPTPAPSWNTVRVFGTWVNQDGSLKTGTYKVEMPVRVTNATDDVIIPKGVFATGVLNTTPGVPSLVVEIPASDDPDNFPTGFQPILTVTFSDAPGEVYALDLPVALSGDPVGLDLRTVVLLDTLPAPVAVLVKGVPGGLAELNADGDVVDADGNVVGGLDPATLDTSTAALVPDAGTATGAALKATYAAHPVKVSDLPTPLVIAHRGAANLFPENTMEAFRGAASLGVPVEGDFSLLTDGGIGAMHDATMDRTTWVAGNTGDQTAMAWALARADTDTYFFGGWGNLQLPTFGQYLGELGGKVVLVPEAKNGTGLTAKMVQRIVAAGLTDSVILQVPNLTEAATASGAGIATMLTTITGTEYGTAAAYAAAGVTYAGVLNTSVTDATIAAFHAAGVKVLAYLLDRHVEVAAWLARGGDGYFTNDPVYAQGATTGYPYRKSKMPLLGTWGHGMSANGAVRGKFSTSPWGFGWDDTTNAGTRSTLIGPINPVKGDPAANTFTLEIDWSWTSYVDTGRWIGLYVGVNDGQLDGSGTTRTGVNGYRVLLTPNGVMNINKVTDNVVGTLLINASYGAFTVPGTLTTRLTVTPTTITWRDVTHAHEVVATDSSYRGGYVSLAASGVTAWCTRAEVTA